MVIIYYICTVTSEVYTILKDIPHYIVLKCIYFIVTLDCIEILVVKCMKFRAFNGYVCFEDG